MSSEDDSKSQQLREALNLSPDNILLRVLLAKHLNDTQKADEAAQVLYEAPNLELPQEEDQVFAATLFLNLGDPKKAISVLNADSPKVMLLKARAYFMQDEMEQAKALYQKAIEANPTLEDKDLESLVNHNREEETREKVKVNESHFSEEDEVFQSMHPPQKSITFQNIGGLEKVKKQITKKIITPFQKPSLFERFKKKIGGGILLYGPPGCGKTLLARATAGECQANFYNIALSDILNMYIGESEQRLHAIFEKARASTPAVLFFDEVEALAGKRENSRDRTSANLVSQFLAELDGFSQNNRGVLVLAATNLPWALDPAFKRPGRFDRVLFIPPPDLEARKAILNIHINERPHDGSLNIDQIAKATSGFSGADLEQLIEAASEEAIDESLEKGHEVPLCYDHLKEALVETKSTTTEWLTTARNYARYSNESGQYDEVLDFLKKYGK